MAANCASLKAGSPKEMEQVFTAPSETSAIIATTALESTPPERKAPSNTTENRRIFTASRRRVINSCEASCSSIAGSGLNGMSQYARGAGTGAFQRSVRVCAGGSLCVCVFFVLGSGLLLLVFFFLFVCVLFSCLWFVCVVWV